MTVNNNIKKAISFIKTELKGLYPEYEISSIVSIIFDHLFNYSKAQLSISQNKEISARSFKKIGAIIHELKLNKPIQYILGETSFYDLSIKVTPDVLIPRQETEELVDWIIKENRNEAMNIIDIGTGSGCIAISLAKNLPRLNIYACDVSSRALDVAKENSASNNIEIQFIQLDILNPGILLDDKFDIIVSNPPYVTEKEKNLMHKNVLNYEPKLALFVPDEDPLRFYRSIVRFAEKHLNPEGKIYFEVNETYGEKIALYMEANHFKDISLRKDINGKTRMLRGILRN